MFKEFFEKNRNKIAVTIEDGKSYTYSNVYDLSLQLFDKINQRCLVFCLCENSIGSLIGYLSFINNQVVSLLLDSNLDTILLNNLLEKYNPQYIWLPNTKIENFKTFEILFSIENYSLIKLKVRQEYNIYDDLAILLTTSGSTGSPKLVRISYKNILANAFAISEYLEISEIEKPITVLPMHYSFGLSIINSHLITGATILLTNRSLMEKEFWEFLKKEKATSFSGVPYTYEILMKLRFFRMELPDLKTFTQAGGKLDIETNRQFSEYCDNNGKRFFVMYGQTEATARMSYLPHENSISKLGSIGIAIPKGQFYLIDENKKIITQNEKSGELVYKGENVSLGYAECVEDLEKGDENNGVLFTGDIAKRDDEGYYYIVGRKKRFIKIFGNRVNLDEVENILKSNEFNCACVGQDDKMIIYITDNNKLEEVRIFISNKIGLHQTAFNVRYIEKIPKNSSGKTVYSKLLN